MSGPAGAPVLIAEPRARPLLGRLERALREAGRRPETEVADPGGGATGPARRAAQEGRGLVVAVGGDRLVNAVVNGLADPEAGRARGDTVLGVVAGPDGCELSRTFGLDLPPEDMLGHLLSDDVFPIDLGRVSFRGRDGTTAVRLFANVAEAGYGAVVAGVLRRLPPALGRVGVLLAGLVAAWRAGRPEVAVELDHTEVREPMSGVVVANGQFFRGGMRVAPRALPDDGLFNVQCWRATPAEVFTALPRLRVGEHLGGGDIREYQSASVQVEAGSPLAVAADGHVLGTTPASFEVLHRVLDLAV